MLICALHCASASLARRRSRDAASGPFLPPASCVSLAQFMCVRRLSSVLAMLGRGRWRSATVCLQPASPCCSHSPRGFCQPLQATRSPAAEPGRRRGSLAA